MTKSANELEAVIFASFRELSIQIKFTGNRP
jgi:hypothetical protein